MSYPKNHCTINHISNRRHPIKQWSQIRLHVVLVGNIAAANFYINTSLEKFLNSVLRKLS